MASFKDFVLLQEAAQCTKDGQEEINASDIRKLERVLQRKNPTAKPKFKRGFLSRYKRMNSIKKISMCELQLFFDAFFKINATGLKNAVTGGGIIEQRSSGIKVRYFTKGGSIIFETIIGKDGELKSVELDKDYSI
jgi:hypothetical protein